MLGREILATACSRCFLAFLCDRDLQWERQKSVCLLFVEKAVKKCAHGGGVWHGSLGVYPLGLSRSGRVFVFSASVTARQQNSRWYIRLLVELDFCQRASIAQSSCKKSTILECLDYQNNVQIPLFQSTCASFWARSHRGPAMCMNDIYPESVIGEGGEFLVASMKNISKGQEQSEALIVCTRWVAAEINTAERKCSHWPRWFCTEHLTTFPQES